MKWTIARAVRILALLALTLALGGCASTGEVENQAYALVLGIDGRDAGGVELTIRIPRIGHADGGDAEGSGTGGAYLVLSAAGDSYAQALEHLQWTAARELNLSHLKLIVVSESLASGADFPALIGEVAETRHLYTTAGFVVCEGRARAFIEGQETILGAQLSSEIDAMFRHYAAHGYIPKSTFADLYYATRACYADPTGIWGFMDANEQPAGSRAAAAILEDDEDRLNAETTTASSRQYLGAALFRDGRMIDRLDAGETLCLNLLTGPVGSFTFECEGRAHVLSTLRGPVKRVRLDGDAVELSATVRLVSEDGADRARLDRAEAALAEALEALVRRCQRLEVDPFGFADRAAARFLTLDQWEGFHWRRRFAGARVSVQVRIA